MQRTKRDWLLVMAVIVCLATSLSAKYSGGSGTTDEPYLIATAGDFNDVNNHPEDSNKCFLIVSDINLAELEGNQFNIISSFSGIFDGDGHTISGFHYASNNINNIGLFGSVSGYLTNITIFEPDVNAGWSQYVGTIAGKLINGTIENCRVESGLVYGRYDVGGLVGYNNGIISLIKGCRFSGSVNKIRNEPWCFGSRIGGLVGYNGNASTIEECSCDANVSGCEIVGGLVGQNENNARITACFADANIIFCDRRAGGLVGKNMSLSIIIDSYSDGSITRYGSCGGIGPDPSPLSKGGLVGLNLSGIVENCYSSVYVWPCGGGLAGSNTGNISSCFWDINESGVNSMLGPNSSYDECNDENPYRGYNCSGLTTTQMKEKWYYGEWACSSNNWVIDEGRDYPRLAWQGTTGIPLEVETLFDKGKGVSTDPYLLDKSGQIYALGYMPCLWDKHFRMVNDIDMNDIEYSNTSPIGFAMQNQEIGRFTGVFDGAGHTISNFKQEQNNKDNTASRGLFSIVYGPNAVIKDLGLINPDINAPESTMGAGGLTGAILNGTITRCFVQGGSICGKQDVGGIAGVSYYINIIIIENCYAETNVTGETHIGGLVGRINSCTISNCFSTGRVTATVQYRGGLIGYGSGIVRNSFYDVNTSGLGMPIPLPPPIPMPTDFKTTEQMQLYSTFADAGWDFNDIWHICEPNNYPRLLWQVPPADIVCPYGIDFVDYSFFASHWLEADYGGCNGVEINCDGKVDLAEFVIFANHWGQTGCGNCGGADYSGDGNVDSTDLGILCDNWLATYYGDMEGAELTGDGIVDLDDLKEFAFHWLQGI